jgi:hypothetical protein
LRDQRRLEVFAMHMPRRIGTSSWRKWPYFEPSRKPEEPVTRRVGMEWEEGISD